MTDEPAPRVAERVDPYDRRRQPVNLELPEPDEDAELPPQGLPDDMEPERAPVESFPQPQLIEPRLQRGPGHTPALDEEPPTLIDPSAHQSATRPRRAIPGPVPRLRDQDPELAFPGHRQMSGERTGGFLSVEPAISRVTIRNCCLTRDIQSGKKANIIQATDLVKGQQLVVQTDVEGLERIQRGRELVSRLTCHVAICDAQNKVLYRTSTHSKTEVTYAADSARHVAERLTIPARFKEGDYRLQLHVQDDIAHQVTVVEMPVTIR